MENERIVSRGVIALLVLLWLAGTLRAFVLWSHDPLHAYANSYDQTRYTTCFGFHPDRPLAIPPQTNSPQSPFSDYRFLPVETPFCYWSSELAFTAATAAVWHAEEALGLGEVHDVRWVGALRWLALLALSIGLSRAWLRRGDMRAALANAALVPLVFADPGNTLYMNTFYAEWTALLAAYATIALALLWRDEARSRRRLAILALVAFALAASKIQHLVLPLGLAAVVFLLDRARSSRTSWRALALAGGAFAGLSLQVVQLQREGPLMDAIDQYNRADVLFTALLPFAEDKRALLEELHVDPDCAKYVGLHAWELPDLPERVCRGLDGFRRGAELRTLATHPRIALRLAGHGVLALDPWIAKNLGQIEGRDFATIPALPSIGRLLHAWPWLQLVLLAAPLLALVVLLRRPGPRRGARALDLAALVAVTMLGTLAVTILGDGLADTGKQGHLVVNAALVWVCVGVVFSVARIVRRA
ncbi:hypothetical protein [Dokdonella sp.]|uniref:hypothetical protein n=1 Tax=Dokdonella sp. TaxID=2291710 RepID=UPI0037853121